MKFPLSKKVIIWLLLILLALLCYYAIGQNSKYSNYRQQMALFDVKEQAYLETINENGERLIEQQQIIMSQDDAIASGLLEIEKLKEVNSQVSVVTNTIIDTIVVSHVDTVIQQINGNAYLKLPQQYSFNDDFINFKAEINEVGLSVDNITIFNETTVTIGKEKQGLFKPLKPVVKIKNTNPYMNTMSVQNVVIEKKTNLIHDKRAWGVVGIFIGLALN